MYPKVSGLAAWGRELELLLGAVVSLFCELCYHDPLCCFYQRVFIVVISLSIQSGNFWIHPRTSSLSPHIDVGLQCDHFSRFPHYNSVFMSGLLNPNYKFNLEQPQWFCYQNEIRWAIKHEVPLYVITWIPHLLYSLWAQIFSWAP